MGMFALIIVAAFLIALIVVIVLWNKEPTSGSQVSYDKIRSSVRKSNEDLLNLIGGDEEEEEEEE